MKSNHTTRWIAAAVAVLAIAATVFLLRGSNEPDRLSLVVYCAHDAVFADEVL
jgi:hypothetical protein